MKLHTKRNRLIHETEVDIEGDKILANDVILPGEYNPHNVRFWVIGNEFGALGAVWASCESDALDALVDSGLGNGLLIEEKDADEDCARLGNAGEPADLTYCWLGEVEFVPSRDWKLLCAFAEARALGADNLDDGRIYSRPD